MILTKKYRLIWNNNLKIIVNPFDEYDKDKTYVGKDLNSYQNIDVEKIKEKILIEKLTYTEPVFYPITENKDKLIGDTYILNLPIL